MTMHVYFILELDSPSHNHDMEKSGPDMKKIGTPLANNDRIFFFKRKT